MGDGLALTVFYRYPPHGRKPAKEESGVQWSRVRSPPVSTPAHDLHASGCLGDLRPGDHFEIQWRKNKDFPYGWWYGVVGHQETCNANEHLCRCHEDGKDPVYFLPPSFVLPLSDVGTRQRHVRPR
jgi:hypothetical protein